MLQALLLCIKPPLIAFVFLLVRLQYFLQEFAQALLFERLVSPFKNYRELHRGNHVSQRRKVFVDAPEPPDRSIFLVRYARKMQGWCEFCPAEEDQVLRQNRRLAFANADFHRVPLTLMPQMRKGHQKRLLLLTSRLLVFHGRSHGSLSVRVKQKTALIHMINAVLSKAKFWSG